MGRPEGAGKKLLLKEIRKRKRRSSTRLNLYAKLSKEIGASKGSLRNIVSRAHLTCRKFSLMCAFSQEEEDALVNVCIAFARKNEPFTIPDFIKIASIFNGRNSASEYFTRSFVRRFRNRHSGLLSIRKGKVTSPTRWSSRMKEKTEDFIRKIDKRIASHKMNESNTFVFDETIIGNSISLPLVIGERRKSGGGNINVFHTREKALGCYIPFSMPDGSTPFRVYIFRAGKLKEGQELLDVVVPDTKFDSHFQPHRLFLASETGYLTTELFKRVMDEFTTWWTTINPDLHCFLVSDNLHIHKNKTIVKDAKDNGIHMYNIMPGSSHWFQVHDQKPFGFLKKKIEGKKISVFIPDLRPPKVTQGFTCMYLLSSRGRGI